MDYPLGDASKEWPARYIVAQGGLEEEDSVALLYSDRNQLNPLDFTLNSLGGVVTCYCRNRSARRARCQHRGIGFLSLARQTSNFVSTSV